jgi:hypothetical protein
VWEFLVQKEEVLLAAEADPELSGRCVVVLPRTRMVLASTHIVATVL